MQRRLYSFLNADFSTPSLILGYIFGLFIPMFFKSVPFLSHISEIKSVFMSDTGFNEFISLACTQTVFPILIFISGFIPCCAPISAAVLFLRSALASYSSLALAFSGASDYLYVLHTICGIFVLAVCWAISKCSHANAQEKSSPRDSLLYTLEFLFFVGILFITVFCRHIALAFV